MLPEELLTCFYYAIVGSVNFVNEFKLDELVGSSVLKHGGACTNAGAAFSFYRGLKLSKPASSVFPSKLSGHTWIWVDLIMFAYAHFCRRRTERFLHHGSGEGRCHWQATDPLGRS